MKTPTKTYKVCYSELHLCNINVVAETAEEAERMVMDGNVDFDMSVQDDAIIAGVNCVVEVRD